MIPSRRCYVLLTVGGLTATLLDMLANRQVSLNFLQFYNFALLVATIADASRVKKSAIEVTRQEIQRLSVGRDNPIELHVKSGSSTVIAHICDAYPQQFTVDTDIEVNLPCR